MRRWAAVGLALATTVVGSGCGAGGGIVAHGRQGSWERVEDPSLSGGQSFGVAGVVAPGDGYPLWEAIGTVGGPAPGASTATVWTSPDGSRWARVALDAGGSRRADASAGARHQGRAVVVGSATAPAGDRDGRIWTSTDGATWRAVAADPSVLGGPGDQEVTGVAAGPLGFVATGVDRRGHEAVPAVWTSADGEAWSRVGAGPASPFLAGQVVLGVAVGPAGAVAVGTLRTGAETDAMVWFSADGKAWRTVALGLAGFTGPADQAARAVTATGDGFVAVGDDARGDRRVAVVWTSADGITWQRQPPAPDMAELANGDSTAGVFARDVAGTGPVVAVGGGFALQVWTSPDGRRWTREPPPVQDRGSDEGARVATDGRSLLAVVGGAALWFRPPGGSWASAPSDAALFPRPSRSISMHSVARIGDRLVAFGSASEGSVVDDAALWISTDGGRSWPRQDTGGAFGAGSVDALTTSANLLVAVGIAAGQSGSVAAAWVSADQGSTWQRVDAANPAFALRAITQVFGVTAGGPGFVAVGLSYEFRQTIRAHAWYSTDGRSWKRAADPAAWSAPGDHLLNIACPLPGGGVVALGTTTTGGNQDVWAWVSADGATWEQATGPGAMLLGGDGAQYPRSCASTPTGVLVAGISADDAVLWSTTDGRTWSTVGGPTTFTGPERTILTGVAVEGERVVVTGSAGDDMVVFTSADAGATWARRTAASFGGFGLQVGRPVLRGDEVVVAGTDGPGAGVWIGPAL